MTPKNTAFIAFLIFLLAGLISFTPSPGFAQEVIFQEILVKPGDTLWSIAKKYLKNPRKWPDIVKYNKLPTSDPTIALPGTKIKVPILLIKEEYRKARLIQLIPDVRYKRKGEKEWKEAKKNLTLHYEDSLRTMKGAQARVKLPSKEVVQINENTYVVLRPERILQEIELWKGEVRAQRARIIMPQGTVVQPRGNRSDFQAKVREDETEVVFVYKGKVDVTARGKTVTVLEGFGTEVPKFSPPKKPIPLSEFKDFNPIEMMAVAPAGASYPGRVGHVKSILKPPTGDPKKVRNKRSKVISSDDILVSYTVQLAKNKKFSEIVFERTETLGSTFDIKKSNIPDGTYYMRVAFTDALGVKGPYSQPTLMVQDTKAPLITNLFPKEGQRFSGSESYCDVIGEVKGATLVAINDEVVFISPTGRFNKFMPLKEGKNKIVVVARDVNGNETVINRTVIYTKN